MAHLDINSATPMKVDVTASPRVRRLIIMTRIPDAGRVKTRLIPVLGSEGAATLHEALLRRTLHHAELHSRKSDVDVEVRFTGGTALSIETLSLGLTGTWREQQGTDLGRRMQLAIEDAFAEGHRQVVVIGTDCPDLSHEILSNAWRELVRNDVVLGPATDGGYYLIGVNQPDIRLFLGVDWGTENVLRQTMERCREMQFTVGLLHPLTDIDEAENLVVCRRLGTDLQACLPQTQQGLLSIIVPTLNEVDQLEATVGPLVKHPRCEVIVADGGSSDGTVDVAQRLGCRVVQANRGRGRQMNAGAAMARGDVLLFLHADTRLPLTFADDLQATLKDGVIAGAFRLHIDQPRWGLRWVEWGANLRSQRRQLPYGDQGLFLRACDFFRIGGFQNWPLMEDYEISLRLRRLGHIAVASSAATTSARRWQTLGVVRTTLINQFCIFGYHVGVSPERLALWYASIRHSQTDRQRSGRRFRWLMMALTTVLLLSLAGFIFLHENPPASRTLKQDRQILAGMMAENRREFPDAEEVDVTKVVELTKQQHCVLVDVRTEAERNISIIPGAISAAEFERTIKAHTGKTVVCYCTIGYRSAKYADAMKRRGIAVASFNGSIVAWCQAGQKLTTPEGRETNRVHVYGSQWDLIPPDYVSVR